MVKNVTKILLSVICIVAFFYSTNLFSAHWREIYAKFFPCKKPIIYNIVSIDDRFGLSKSEFTEALFEAEEIWEEPLNLDLFELSETITTGGVLKVNLTYDYRQEATDKMSQLGISVDNTRRSYDELKRRYELMQDDYLVEKKEYEKRGEAFSSRQEAYLQQVEEWNSRGGAPENVYNELNQEMESLKKEFEILKKMEENLNKQIENINALVTVINKTARNLNLNTSTLNNINKERGEEFTQGEYQAGENGREINIYEFSTKDKLVRVLAHEFGHALGLDHIEDIEAIMYRLNENKTGKLSKGDLEALKNFCNIERNVL